MDGCCGFYIIKYDLRGDGRVDGMSRAAWSETGGTTLSPAQRGRSENRPDRLSQMAKMAKNGQKWPKMAKNGQKTPKIHAFLPFFGHFWLRTAFDAFFGGVPTKPGFRMASQNAIFAIHSL